MDTEAGAAVNCLPSLTVVGRTGRAACLACGEASNTQASNVRYHMILIIGAILARPETASELRRLSVEHVHRSRAEPGCLSHDVHIDAENPLRLVFVERWADADAVRAHFAVPASRAFVRAAGGLAAEPPVIHVYQAETVTV